MKIERDEICECPRCSSDCCYKLPISKDITNYSCMGCGFNSTTAMKRGNDFFNEQMELLPNLYKELMGEDENGNIWIPSSTNIHDLGMIFAMGSGVDDWKWAAVKAVPIKEEEKTKYPIPNKKGEFYKWRMDFGTIQKFEENDFMSALSYLGLLTFDDENKSEGE